MYAGSNSATINGTFNNAKYFMLLVAPYFIVIKTQKTLPVPCPMYAKEFDMLPKIS